MEFLSDQLNRRNRSKVHDFLKQLTHCRIRKGEDPSPGGLHEPGHVAISLQSYKYPSISFYSRRLDHVPWKVSLGDNNYLIQSDCPAKAWAILAPYLRDDVYQQFLQGK